MISAQSGLKLGVVSNWFSIIRLQTSAFCCEIGYWILGNVWNRVEKTHILVWNRKGVTRPPIFSGTPPPPPIPVHFTWIFFYTVQINKARLRQSCIPKQHCIFYFSFKLVFGNILALTLKNLTLHVCVNLLPRMSRIIFFYSFWLFIISRHADWMRDHFLLK